MENLAHASVETPPRSSADLSVEISRLVARRMRGEEIDTAASGDALALRFPEVGLSGDLIAQAIERAAGMMDMIHDGGVAEPAGAPEPEKSRDPLTSDAALAAAIDAELSELVGGPIGLAARQANGDSPESSASAPEADIGAEQAKAEAGAPDAAHDKSAARSRGLLGRMAAAFSRG